MSGDTTKEDSKAAPISQTLPRTGEKCKQCPPEGGAFKRANHSMTAAAREYQGRITGWPYSVEEAWSQEWNWQGIEFDGFIPAQCMLQEAKGNYDQFLEMQWAIKAFRGFDKMASTIVSQGTVVRENPPTRLTWYFQGPKLAQKWPVCWRSGASNLLLYLEAPTHGADGNQRSIPRRNAFANRFRDSAVSTGQDHRFYG
jgi:hypothetical protein